MSFSDALERTLFYLPRRLEQRIATLGSWQGITSRISIYFSIVFAARDFYKPPRATDDHSARVILIPQPLLAARIMGLLYTAKGICLEPYVWLTDDLARLPETPAFTRSGSRAEPDFSPEPNTMTSRHDQAVFRP